MSVMERDLRMELLTLEGLPPVELPEAYSLTTAEAWDVPDVTARWLGLLQAAFPEIGTWFEDSWRDRITSKPQFDPAGVFFVLHGGEAVATAFAWLDIVSERECGRVHWVASHPDHRGARLGRMVTLAVLHYFRARGFRRACLDTQLYRVPAIRTYVKLGFAPAPADEEEREAWERVLAGLQG